MRIQEVFRFALRGLRANKLRSGLTTLGILIGVGAVILLIAVGQGSGAAVQARIDSLGSNLLLVTHQTGAVGRAASTRGGTQSSTANLTPAIAQDLADSDQDPDVSVVAPVASTSVTATYDGASTTISQVVGSYPAYLPISNDVVAQGASFTANDVDHANKVVVIGQTVVTDLFGSIDPIGQTIQMNNVPYTVVGVLASKGGGSTFNDPDDVAIAPLTTVQDSLTGFGSLSEIAVQATSAGATGAAQAEVTNLLLDYLDETASTEQFTVTNEASLLSTAQSTTQTFTVLLAAVAAISLLVGGIGVTNIMLVTVTERTREIGIRKALGAPKGAILGQFLIEAVFLSVIGGALGVLVGVVGSRFTIDGIQPVLVPSSIALAFGVSAVIGLVFGSLPANRAAKLHPIEALRHE
ncbi:ABC transporter permease [Actinospica sp. MGRD01-02]|uniref:ABC transporter permease n=1 Tax=Actinospica acidithermotolerans TaxID=2828514 RepID=A0A941IIA0_9ACTN|nr:ABC transporter permease [Actinospica acidithermotolerans]MBR7828119.1 ABC transporter permease [Actinospica acidithermotolerans]